MTPKQGPDPLFVELLVKGVMIALVSLAIALLIALAAMLVIWLYGAIL